MVYATSLFQDGAMRYFLPAICSGLVVIGGGMGAAEAQQPATAATAAAGRVIMAVGAVSIQRAGVTAPAKRGAELAAGDTVITGATSNAQLRLADGAVIALRPDSEFKIDAFNYSGQADGTESATLSLVKGGVRAVTGTIGRGNRGNLKINAVVATVGIRGTGFNIRYCDAACQATEAGASLGLFAGVFEGAIGVDSAAGTSGALGVNRFVYVENDFVVPRLLIAPPPFLKDSLEAQVLVKSKDLSLNEATENNAALESSAAVTNSPTSVGAESIEVTTVQVNKVTVNPILPAVVTSFPVKFFDNPALGDLGDITAKDSTDSRIFAFQSAEFNPAGTDRLANNQIIQNVNRTRDVRAVLKTGSAFEIGEVFYDVAATPTTTASRGYYSIVNSYSSRGVAKPITNPARQIEGGTDGGVIAWGRWADGQAFVQSYGLITLTAQQGFHWITGERITFADGREIVNADSSWSFTLLAATTPTEARTDAREGWRVTGGRFNARLANRSVTVSDGLLNLYFARSGEGFGAYDFNFAGSSTSISSTQISGLVKRVDGTATLCILACAATGAMGFYGDSKNRSISHAGLTYEFNTNPAGTDGYVQGVAIFTPKPPSGP